MLICELLYKTLFSKMGHKIKQTASNLYRRTLVVVWVILKGSVTLTLTLLLVILTEAKYLIAAFWKRSAPPSSMDLHLRVKEIRPMEYLTASLNNRIDHFDSIWSLWNQYIVD